MSGTTPARGTYIISSRASPGGERLAITYNGQSNAVTVTPKKDTSVTQYWIISSFGEFGSGKSTVVPYNSQRDQAAWGKGYVTVLPAGNYVWILEETAGGWTIQDGGKTAFWGLDQATQNSQVTIGPGTGHERQRWILEKVV